MKKQQLIALKPFTFAGKRVIPGQVFSSKGRSEVNALIALGMAEPALLLEPVPMVPQEPISESVSMVATSEEAEISPRTGRPKRAYRRRDVTAEE